MFILHPKNANPIPLGDYLGDMSDQYPSHRILAYYSTGCKAYALKLEDKESGKIEHVVKVRGITMSRAAGEKIHFQTFKVRKQKVGDGCRRAEAIPHEGQIPRGVFDLPRRCLPIPLRVRVSYRD